MLGLSAQLLLAQRLANDDERARGDQNSRQQTDLERVSEESSFLTVVHLEKPSNHHHQRQYCTSMSIIVLAGLVQKMKKKKTK